MKYKILRVISKFNNKMDGLISIEIRKWNKYILPVSIKIHGVKLNRWIIFSWVS